MESFRARGVPFAALKISRGYILPLITLPGTLQGHGSWWVEQSRTLNSRPQKQPLVVKAVERGRGRKCRDDPGFLDEDVQS